MLACNYEVKNMKLWLILASFFCFGFCACTVANQASNNVNKADEKQNSENLLNNSSANDTVLQEKPSPQQDVRSIDFKNFTYHWFPKYGEVIIKENIVLRNGKNAEIFIEGAGIRPTGELYQEYLSDVSYADLTGDGKEEAIVTVAVSFYRWTPRCIFIFSEKNGKAILLWQYETDVVGKNLNLRGHKIKDSELIIEEYDTKYGNPPICCPERYFRKTFAWNGRTFEEKETKIIPYNKNSREFSDYPSDENK